MTTRRITSWAQIVEWVDTVIGDSWVFRGHARAEWELRTSLEREFTSLDPFIEAQVLQHFVRTAPRWLPSHLVPDDLDVAAWLGLIQHYGGPTRLLDVTRSPYVALFFAFESPGAHDRAVWAVDLRWCMRSCAQIMAAAEQKSYEEMHDRTAYHQDRLVACLVDPYDLSHRPVSFMSFQAFTGIFPLDPWKPDPRQSAQQALFLCAAAAPLSFMENLAACGPSADDVYRIELPAALREEALEHLAVMNVTAATLIPDLSGLARSLRTIGVRRPFRLRPALSELEQ